MAGLTQAQVDAINGAARNPYMPGPGGISPGAFLANPGATFANGVGSLGIPPDVTQQLSTPLKAKNQVYSPTKGAIEGQNMPLLAVQTSDGKVGTSRLDGQNVQSFDSWDAFKAYVAQSGEGYIGAPAGQPGSLTEDQAIQLTRQWTGDQSYNGAKGLSSMDQYKPPTIQPGSPAALGVNAPDPSQWLKTATGSPSNPNTPPSSPVTTPGTGGPPATPAPGTGTNTPSEGFTPPPPPTTAVTPPTQGGIGNFLSPDSAGKTNPATGLGPGASWQTILSSLMNAGLIKSQGSNQLIDLATGQLANAQNRTNSIDANQGTVQQFIKSMIDQANTTTSTRDQGIQTILQNVGNGGLLGNAGSLLNTLQAGSSTGSAPGNVQFDPAVANIANGAVNSNQGIINTAATQAGQNPLSLVDPNVQSSITAALKGAQSFVNSYDPNNPYGPSTPGLSPQAQAALRLNQTQVIPGQFNDALSSAYAELQRRGALGGELPGSQSDLMRTLAPIFAARASAYSSANSQNILTNAQLQEQQRQQNANLASTGVGQLTGAANSQISANAQAIQQWLQTQNLGQTATQSNLNAGGLINSQDALAVQQLLSNRTGASSLINSMGGLIGTIGQTYNPTQLNSLASGGIGDLTSLINSGTSALNSGNDAVNAATGAYAAGNAPLATATAAGQTAANDSPGSVMQQFLAALLSSGAANAGGIAAWLKNVFNQTPGTNPPPISPPFGTNPGDVPPVGSTPPYNPGIPGLPGGGGNCIADGTC